MDTMDRLSNMFSKQEVQVQGTVCEGYEAVKEVFEKNFRNGEELSAQVCVYKKGEKVVDLWASSVSPSYSGDSMQTIWSSTKNLTALAMAMMVDRGLLAYSDRVAKHWPEFGQKDKHLITVADVLRHEGGLPFFSKQMDIEDSWPEHIKDNGVGRIIEGEEPCFPAGSSRREYHAITRGFVLQEVFRRVEPARRTIGQFLSEEVFEPLGVDVFIGLDEKKQKEMSIADVVALADKEVQEAASKNTHSDVLKQLTKFREYLGETEGKRPDHKEAWRNTSGGIGWWNDVPARRAEIPSAGGLASARGLAAVANMMAQGGKVGERTFLTPAGWQEMHANSTEGETFGMKTFYTQGGVNHYQDGPQGMEETPCLGAGGVLQYGQLVPKGMYGWGGYGGSLFLWDPAREIGFAYIPTYLAWYDKEKQRGTRLLREAVFKCL